MESQLRTYDNQVDYSTVYLYVNEVTQLTPVKEQSLGEKIATGFMNSLYSVGHGLLNFVVGLIIRLPYLVVGGIIIVGVIWIIKAIRKSRRKRKQKKEMKMAETVQAAVEVNLEQDNGSRE
jgi:Flp pilus assembly protein TadB